MNEVGDDEGYFICPNFTSIFILLYLLKNHCKIYTDMVLPIKV